MDPTTQKSIQKRLQKGDYVSPAEKEEYAKTMGESSRSGYYGSNAVDALATTAANLGIKQSGLLDGVPFGGAMAGGIASLTGDALSGKLNEGAIKNTLTSTAKGGLKDIARYGVSGMIGGLPGAVVSGSLGSMLSESFSTNPNYTRAATSSAMSFPFALAGSAFGPLGTLAGGMLGGTLVGGSLRNGVLGDAFDMRINEGYRDKLEDEFGYTAGKAQYDGFSGLGSGTQLSLLEGGFGPENIPSGQTLANNTNQFDPIGGLVDAVKDGISNLGEALSGMFDGNDNDNDSDGGWNSQDDDRDSQPGGMGGL